MQRTFALMSNNEQYLEENNLLRNLRKLIKYEEGLGVDIHRNDYFRDLYNRTTASYRAKTDQENTQRKRREVSPPKEKHYPRSSREQQRTTRPTAESKNIETKNRSSLETTREPRGITDLKHTDLDTYLNNAGITRFNSRNLNNQRIRFEESFLARSKPPDFTETGPVKNPKTRSRSKSPNVTKTSSRLVKNPTTQNRGPNKPTEGEGPPATTRSENSAASRAAQIARPGTARSLSGTIIPRSKSQERRKLAHDPVALYHYYQKEWKHFRKQIPGETSHADLRWQIRHKFKS